MSSIRFGGILFVVYPNDHEPRHVHGFLQETEVIVDLLYNGNVAQASRKDAVRPPDAKRADVKKILQNGADNFQTLVELWEKMHGTAQG